MVPALLRRLAIVASLPFIVGAAPGHDSAPPPSLPPGPLPPAADQALARDVMAQIVAVRSVHAVGTAEVARILEARLREGGFTDADLAVVGDPKFPNQINVVVRLRGKGKGKPILWHGHTDIVEAKAEDWSVPPFQLTERDGWFYGRGVSDMKGDDAVMLASLVRLKREGFVPDRDIIVAFTADEEVGLEQDGADWLVRNRRDLVDAAYAIDTDSYTGKYDGPRRLGLFMDTSEKIYVTFLLEVTNPGGHSSHPRPDNAIYSLAAGLGRLAAFEFPVKTNATTRLYFQRAAALEGPQTKADMLAVSGQSPDLAAAARLSREPAFNALLRSTCVATMLAAGDQENALAQRATATVQCRIMPDETPEQTRQTLVGVLADPTIAVRIPDKVVSGPESPPTPEIVGKVQRVAEQMWPGVPVIPSMAAGASDSLYLRSAGIPTYTVSGIFEDIHDDRDHANDERISVRAFNEDLEFTYRLMKETASVP